MGPGAEKPNGSTGKVNTGGREGLSGSRSESGLSLGSLGWPERDESFPNAAVSCALAAGNAHNNAPATARPTPPTLFILARSSQFIIELYSRRCARFWGVMRLSLNRTGWPNLLASNPEPNQSAPVNWPYSLMNTSTPQLGRLIQSCPLASCKSIPKLPTVPIPPYSGACELNASRQAPVSPARFTPY